MCTAWKTSSNKTGLRNPGVVDAYRAERNQCSFEHSSFARMTAAMLGKSVCLRGLFLPAPVPHTTGA